MQTIQTDKQTRIRPQVDMHIMLIQAIPCHATSWHCGNSDDAIDTCLTSNVGMVPASAHAYSNLHDNIVLQFRVALCCNAALCGLGSDYAAACVA